MDFRGQIQHHILPVCLQDDPNPQLMFCHRSNLTEQTTSVHRLHIFTLTKLFDFCVWNLIDFCIHSSPKMHSGLCRSSPYHNWLTGDLLLLPFLSKLLLTMKLDLTATRKTKLRRCQAGKMCKTELFMQVKEVQKFLPPKHRPCTPQPVTCTYWV